MLFACTRARARLCACACVLAVIAVPWRCMQVAGLTLVLSLSILLCGLLYMLTLLNKGTVAEVFGQAVWLAWTFMADPGTQVRRGTVPTRPRVCWPLVFRRLPVLSCSLRALLLLAGSGE